MATKKLRMRKRKSRTYKGGSNGSTTFSGYQYRTAMIERALEQARRKEQQESGHSKNRPGPGTLNPKNAARYREYNKVNSKRR